jgi:TolB-like protein
MSPENDTTNPTVGPSVPADPAAAAEQQERKKKKKKDKVRSAWISFVGRIIAQIMGAVATICLGLLVVHKYQGPAKGQAAAAAQQQTSTQALPTRAVTPGEVALAVLPLENFSSDSDASFADSMTEQLITDLSRLEGIRVLSRTSSMRYKHDRKRIPEIGQELGVHFVLEGSIAKADGRVRITAQLIDARSDEHVWADSYERPLREVLALQSKVSTAIAQSVKDAIAGNGTRRSRATVLRIGEPVAPVNQP